MFDVIFPFVITFLPIDKVWSAGFLHDPSKIEKKNENLKFKYSTFSYLYNKVVFSFIIYYSYNVMLINI